LDLVLSGEDEVAVQCSCILYVESLQLNVSRTWKILLLDDSIYIKLRCFDMSPNGSIVVAPDQCRVCERTRDTDSLNYDTSPWCDSWIHASVL